MRDTHTHTLIKHTYCKLQLPSPNENSIHLNEERWGHGSSVCQIKLRLGSEAKTLFLFCKTEKQWKVQVGSVGQCPKQSQRGSVVGWLCVRVLLHRTTYSIICTQTLTLVSCAPVFLLWR